jgi:hypothetical protein
VARPPGLKTLARRAPTHPHDDRSGHDRVWQIVEPGQCDSAVSREFLCLNNFPAHHASPGDGALAVPGVEHPAGKPNPTTFVDGSLYVEDIGQAVNRVHNRARQLVDVGERRLGPVPVMDLRTRGRLFRQWLAASQVGLSWRAMTSGDEDQLRVPTKEYRDRMDSVWAGIAGPGNYEFSPQNRMEVWVAEHRIQAERIATARLALASWVLVAVTLALVVVTAALVYVTAAHPYETVQRTPLPTASLQAPAPAPGRPTQPATVAPPALPSPQP